MVFRFGLVALATGMVVADVMLNVTLFFSAVCEHGRFRAAEHGRDCHLGILQLPRRAEAAAYGFVQLKVVCGQSEAQSIPRRKETFAAATLNAVLVPAKNRTSGSSDLARC